MKYFYLLYIFLMSLRNVAMGTCTASARLSAFASAYAPFLVSGLLNGKLNYLIVLLPLHVVVANVDCSA